MAHGLGPGSPGSQDDCRDSLDDIGRFEKALVVRRKAAPDARSETSSDGDPLDTEPMPAPQKESASDAWRKRAEQLEVRLQAKERELAAAQEDAEVLQQDAAGDVVHGDLKQRILELTKKNRALQTAVRSRDFKVQEAEQRVKKLEQARESMGAGLVLQQAAPELGNEDYKKKYLEASNRMQEMRRELSQIKTTVQRQKKVLMKELGSEAELEKALSVADDPFATAWRGRAAQVSMLQRQVKDLREQDEQRAAPTKREPRDDGAGALDEPVPKANKKVSQMADERRAQLERQAAELEKAKGEAAEMRKKLDAARSRVQVLETQTRELKAGTQALLAKGEHDDETVRELREYVEALELRLEEVGDGGGEEVQELEEQVQRQSRIILQLRQKQLQPDQQRPQHLEVENERLREQTKLLQQEVAAYSATQASDSLDGTGRPTSAESVMALREQLARIQKGNQMLRQQVSSKEHECAELRAQLAATAQALDERERVVQKTLEHNDLLKRELRSR